MKQPIDVIGVGSPIVDLVAEVSDEFLLSILGGKGGMELIDTATMISILSLLDREPVRAPGGSAGNTTFALARLGMRCAFLGKIGDDENGAYYRAAFHQAGGDCSRFKMDGVEATARCISLVTPDSERTMRTHLGAAMNLGAGEIVIDDFQGCRHAHIEGYLLFNRELLMAVLNTAKEAGCTVSLDLGSFEVVESARDLLPEILDRYVDIVFANEDEAACFCGSRDITAGLVSLNRHCAVVAVKKGRDGAWLTNDSDSFHVPAVPVETVLDTTGAGDFWAAGFLYGYLGGYPISTCGRFGAILGAQVVQCMGAALSEEQWKQIAHSFTSIT